MCRVRVEVGVRVRVGVEDGEEAKVRMRILATEPHMGSFLAPEGTAVVMLSEVIKWMRMCGITPLSHPLPCQP